MRICLRSSVVLRCFLFSLSTPERGQPVVSGALSGDLQNHQDKQITRPEQAQILAFTLRRQIP